LSLDAPPPPAYTAKVTLDGKPLDGAILLVVPPNSGMTSIAVGHSDPSGQATLYPVPGQVAKSGQYTILIARWLPRENARSATSKPGVLDTPPGMVNTLPELYSDLNNTPFKAIDIGPKLELPPLDLKSKP
jgi:hypothetical protein